MNKDLIETPRFNFFIGDEVLLKGKIVGFDVDENKCVENVVRLEYGQTLNVPNNNIYITDDIVDKSKIKVVVPLDISGYGNRVHSVHRFPGIFLTVGESIQLKILFYKRIRNLTADHFLTFRESDWKFLISDLVNEFVR
ncbi:Uncharacterised protein [Streptococcus pneumoniae]|nr:hypothetical protein [Streptococcus pneumoniae]VIQ23832.1 Uncharacterised protein [Streptococcus pneumoniae]VMK77979.1 Uncharacterised protein [Streptococcus pneumoniae]